MSRAKVIVLRQMEGQIQLNMEEARRIGVYRKFISKHYLQDLSIWHVVY